MICLTGDIHHQLNAPNQALIQTPEISLATNYLSITARYRLKTTLFITGKTFKESEKKIKEISHFNNLEIGGHTWSALKPAWLHSFFTLTTGSFYGPKSYQHRDIKRTLQIIKEKTGFQPVSWRTHSYQSDKNTVRLLEKNGVRILSDRVLVKKLKPYKIPNSNLISLPINVLPDHEHLYHGKRNEEQVRKLINKGWQDDFTNQSYQPDRYFEIIKQQVKKIEKQGGIATLLLHPICMKIVDNFQSFEKFCQWLRKKNYKTICCQEITTITKNEN